MRHPEGGTSERQNFNTPHLPSRGAAGATTAGAAGGGAGAAAWAPLVEAEVEALSTLRLSEIRYHACDTDWFCLLLLNC